MKRITVFITLISLSVLAVSCKKEQLRDANREMTDDPSKEIVLAFGDELGLDIGVQTKADASAITTVAGLGTIYWGATTGSSGSETSKYGNTSATAAATVATGKYQTATPTAYNWYVSNNSLSISSSTTISASNNKDVVCGRKSKDDLTTDGLKTTPPITLSHIFARTGTLTLNSRSGYTDTAVHWYITGKGSNTGTAGTYNLTSGAWSSTTALSKTEITSSSDKYLIPGTYTIEVNFTHVRGDYSVTLTKSADITLVAGKQNNITATVTTDGANQIQLSLSLTDWSANSISVNLPA